VDAIAVAAITSAEVVRNTATADIATARDRNRAARN
jgi:hypothetical protein